VNYADVIVEGHVWVVFAAIVALSALAAWWNGKRQNDEEES
jgi:hypothetical protein